MRQHIRLSHREEYNNNIAAENKRAATKQYLWTEDEDKELAKQEARCNLTTTSEILDFLCTKSNRSREAIRSRRKREQYKTAVRLFKEEAEQLNISEHQINEQQITPAIHKEILRRLLDEILLTEPTDSSEEDRQFCIEIQIPNNTNALDMYVQWILKKFSPKSKKNRLITPSNWTSSNTNTGSNRINPSQATNSRKRRVQSFRKAQTLYKRNVKSYVEKLLSTSSMNNENILTDCPAPESMCKHFQSIFSSPSILDTTPVND